MLQLQHLLVDTTPSWGESLASEMQKLQNAKNPWQLATTQYEAGSQQLDLYAKEVAAAVQQMYDSQLLWLGNWDKTVETAETLDRKASPENFVLATWGKAQDEWLQLTRKWIDSLKSTDAVQ